MSELPDINWNKYEKYCGTGVHMFFSGTVGTDYNDYDAPAAPAKSALPDGVRVGLVTGHRPTPAEQAGIRSGDIITHVLTATGWKPVRNFAQLEDYFLGPVGSNQTIRLITPGEAARETTIQKAWIIDISPTDPIRQRPDFRELMEQNLGRISNHKNPDMCDMVSSVSPENLMGLTPPPLRLAAKHSLHR